MIIPCVLKHLETLYVKRIKYLRQNIVHFVD
jgi:hypothetical protein